MSGLVGNPEDRLSGIAAQHCVINLLYGIEVHFDLIITQLVITRFIISEPKLVY